MAGTIGIQIVGNVKGVERMLLALDTALNPVAIGGFLQGVVEPYLRERASSRFAQEGDDVVGKWAPLKESTQSYRTQAGYGASHPINRRTGELEEYITGSPVRQLVAPWGAALTMPGNPPAGDLKEKVSIAQIGGGEYNTIPRPVLGMNHNDLLFVLTGLAFHIESVGKGII